MKTRLNVATDQTELKLRLGERARETCRVSSQIGHTQSRILAGYGQRGRGACVHRGGGDGMNEARVEQSDREEKR